MKTTKNFKKSKHDELFGLVKKDNKIIIVVGAAQISPKTFDTFQQAEDYIGSKPYELIVNLCAYCVINHLKNENNKEVAKDA